MLRLRTGLFSSLALAGCVGCGVGDGARGVRDASICLDPSSAEYKNLGWVAQAPTVEIGSDPSDIPTALYRVQAVRRLSDGRIAVANSGTNEIRFFGSDGGYLATFGRRGSGPDEFQNLSDVYRVDGDTLLAFDGFPTRILAIAPDGDFVETLTIQRDAAGPLAFERAVGAIGHTILLLGWRPPDETAFDGPAGSFRPQIELRAFDVRSGQQTRLTDVLGPETGYVSLPRGTARLVLPFGKWTSVMAGPHGIVVGDNGGSDLLMYDWDGQLARTIPLILSPAETSSREVDAYLERRFDENPNWSPAQRAEMESVLEDLPLPERMPGFSRVIMDAVGHFWIELFDPGEGAVSHFAIADPSGVLQGCVALPPGLSRGPDPMVSGDVMEIGESYLLGVWRDSLDVETVRLYQLDRP